MASEPTATHSSTSWKVQCASAATKGGGWWRPAADERRDHLQTFESRSKSGPFDKISRASANNWIAIINRDPNYGGYLQNSQDHQTRRVRFLAGVRINPSVLGASDAHRRLSISIGLYERENVRTMRTSIRFALAAVAVAVVASAGVRPARADLARIEATCQAAHAVDRLVPPTFCKNRLSRHPGAADADVPGLARIAAALGAGNADTARADAARMRERIGDPQYRAALQECAGLYGAARAAFAAADEAIAARRYAAVREKLAGTSHLGNECQFAFVGVGGRLPLVNYTGYNTRYARMCIAITGLINIK
ncbi:hypothetical protein ACP4OV_002726 [Aristida adscensionis]